MDAAEDPGLAENFACITYQVPSREVVRAVDHYVVLANQPECVVHTESRLVRLDDNLRIELSESTPRGHHLGIADRGGVVQDLPLQVRYVDGVVIDDSDFPYPRSR